MTSEDAEDIEECKIASYHEELIERLRQLNFAYDHAKLSRMSQAEVEQIDDLLELYLGHESAQNDGFQLV